ncbi:MAG TPA: GGDEF domain-containing protein [Gemmatimonadales bacterium]|nr:GGDEF domain-containing protein [Gemmatimonadales bacterium]
MSVIAVLLAFGAGILLARRLGGRSRSGGVSGRNVMLPAPAVRWLRASHGALGVWAVGRSGVVEDAIPERAVDEDRVSARDEEVVISRLRLAAPESGPTVERLDGGVLVTEVLGGRVAGILLPGGIDPATLDGARDDLRVLLEALAYRGVAEAWSSERTLIAESPGTVGLALAFELERALNTEALVAAVDGASVRIVGASIRSDRRLLNIPLPAESPLARVARGELAQLHTIHDPAGSVVADRRQRGLAVLVLPIEHDHRVVGAAAISLPHNHDLSASQLSTVTLTLSRAAPRLGLALATEAVTASATTDPLTGLVNRRGLQSAMNRVGVDRGALIYADLDRFKALNDALGHPAGDAALVHFSAVLQEQVRGSDVAARVGGEEFAVWAPGAGLALGTQVAERIRAALADGPWMWQGHRHPLTASFGVAAWPETSSSRQNLEMQADAALYVSKEHGRNRVSAAPTTAA